MIASSPEQIMEHVGRLSLHYPQPDLPEQANAARWEDWFEDFATCPPDLLIAACAAWRRSTARFAPSPGQLLDKIQGWDRLRFSLARRAAEAVELLSGAA